MAKRPAWSVQDDVVICENVPRYDSLLECIKTVLEKR